MILRELLKNIQPTSIKGNTGIDITGIDIDSRQVGEGFMFIAMRGTQVDGHQFIPKAIAQGAKAILCEVLPEDTADEVTYIIVESTERFIVSPSAVATFSYITFSPSRTMAFINISSS